MIALDFSDCLPDVVMGSSIPRKNLHRGIREPSNESNDYFQELLFGWVFGTRLGRGARDEESSVRHLHSGLG
jgi:hypothetical protein